MEVVSPVELVVGVVVLVVGVGLISKHSSSLRDEIATGQSASTVISIPVTEMLGLPLTHFSSRVMSESLSVSEVPSSIARYVTYVWDLG